MLLLQAILAILTIVTIISYIIIITIIIIIINRRKNQRKWKCISNIQWLDEPTFSGSTRHVCQLVEGLQEGSQHDHQWPV